MRKIPKVVPFVSGLEIDRENNVRLLVERAKKIVPLGFEAVEWCASTWLVTDGPLSVSPGKRAGDASINFITPPKLGAKPFNGEWGDVIKALMMLGFHRKPTAMANIRKFVASAGCIAHFAGTTPLRALTHEILDKACAEISALYSESTAYGMHKSIHEFADYCDSNYLCNSLLRYRYLAFKRPLSSNSREQRRLEDAESEITKSEKMVSEKVLEAIGALFVDVPKDHNLRIYVVMLTFLAFLGRRFSELAMLPIQSFAPAPNGELRIYTFPGKASSADEPDPLEAVYVPTEAEEVIKQCMEEFEYLSRSPRLTAQRMRISNGPDLTFIPNVSSMHRFYKQDLIDLGLPNLLGLNGWARLNGFAFPDDARPNSAGVVTGRVSYFTTKEGIVGYCRSHFDRRQVMPLKIASSGKKYFAEDMLLLRFLGTSSGAYAKWIAQPISHAQLTRFIRHDIKNLVKEYVGEGLQLQFTSHQFRHTLNTLLDEGGLSELMQTHWFNRSNPRDTKAYQHSSPQKKALIFREMIKLGEVGGPLADTYHQLPVHQRDAFLLARTRAIHDLGVGICSHSFAQSPCPKGVECHAECDEFSWIKGDEAAKEETVRLYKINVVQIETATQKYSSKRPGASEQWLDFLNKKKVVMQKQLADHGVDAVSFNLEAKGHE